MANEEHLKIIRQGVEAWNAWRQEPLSMRPHLVRADLSGAYLSRANLSGASLSEANLNGAYLGEANLKGADLSEAKLNGADLRLAHLGWAKLGGADLSEAYLREADLSGAYLNGTNLRGADLSGANLKGAHLFGTNFIGADLTDADFTRGDFGGTTFGNTDLSTVKGLETVLHSGPSTLGIDTWFKSNGNIPEAFLKGVGLPEIFLTYSESLIAQPLNFYSCFISYSHADKSFARRLHDSLQGRGIRCWLDEHALLPGDKIYTEVDRGIRLWDKVLLCCSKDSLTSWWVDNEIKIAFDKEHQLWRDRKKEVLALIPLNLDDYLFSGQWQSGLATEVKARLAAQFNGWENDNQKFEEQFERLVKALRTDSGLRESPPQARL